MLLIISFIIGVGSVVAQDRVRSGGLSFEIENKEVRDSTWLEVNLYNNAEDDFWLPLDTIKANQKRNLHCSGFLYKSLNVELKNASNGDVLKSAVLESHGYTATCDSLSKKHFRPSEMICLKAGEYIEFMYFFTLKNSLDDFESNDISYVIPKEETKVYVEVSYLFNREWIYREISRPKVVELDSKGYMPYFDKIESNRVPLIVD